MKKNIYENFKANDGTIIPYKVQGSGKPILFIHGLFGKSDDFNESIEIVSQKYLCISYDQRGHGRSDAKAGYTLNVFAQDLKELIEHLSLEDIILVGYSLGAFTIFNYVEAFGCKHLSKIVLVDITPKMVNDDSWQYGLYGGEYVQENLERDLQMINKKYMRFASYFMYRNMTKSSEKPYRNRPTILSNLLARLLIKNTSKNQKLTFDLWKDVSEQDHRKTLLLFCISTAIFYAEPGSLFMPETAKYMQNKIPNEVKIIPFQDAGHSLVFSHGKQFAEEIVAFATENKPNFVKTKLQ